MIVAVKISKNKNGTTNIIVIKNLAKNVDIPALQISFILFFLSDSSETNIHKASEKASAKAIVIIPPITTALIPLQKLNPTKSPNVVMIPEVMPKVIQVFTDCFICLIQIKLW